MSVQGALPGRPARRIVLACALLVLAACAPVRLIEQHDPRIEDGVTAYQAALQVFIEKTLINYESCKAHRQELTRLDQMRCAEGSAEVLARCEAEIAKAREKAAISRDEACGAASYRGARESFYIPQDARLTVLKTRASVLDATGACVAAMEGVSKLLAGMVPAEVRTAVGTPGAGAATNCTEILVATVLENHKALASGHRCLDEQDAPACGPAGDHEAVSDPATQASFFLPTMLDTLMQNIRIVLFLEQAKKRGATK